MLFFLELHHATGDPRIRTARAGADWLLSQVDSEAQAGLYTGLAGIGFTLTETWKATKDTRYRDGANRVVDRLKHMAKPFGDARGVVAGERHHLRNGGRGPCAPFGEP